MQLSNSQQRAADGFQEFLDDPSIPYMVISGFAGSGKSFLVKYLVELTEKQVQVQKMLDPTWIPPQVYFTATTHKAAEVLRSMTGEDTMTIHSLLKLQPIKGKLVRRRPAFLTNSLVFIDESSMIGSQLMYWINDARKRYPTCRFVFIGDPYQLTPVNEPVAAVFKAAKHHFFLDEIQRQVAGNPIIQLSAKYREVLDDPNQPWPRIQPDGQHIIYYDDYDDFRQVIQQKMGKIHDPQQHKILAWANNTVIDYNRWIRQLHGRKGDFEIGEMVMSNNAIILDNRVIARTDSLHYVTSISEHHFEGIAGYRIGIGSVDTPRQHYIVFQPKNWAVANRILNQFYKDGNKEAYYRLKEVLADLRPTHALTCHKAQGSTYEEVFVDLQDIGRNTKWSEAARLAYVAVTRASRVVHIFGGLRNTYTTKNTSMMEHFADAPLFT